MAENVGVIESEAPQQKQSSTPRVEARVNDALERLANLRKSMPPIDGVKLIREGREQADRGPVDGN